jgi:hypothetical protein
MIATLSEPYSAMFVTFIRLTVGPDSNEILGFPGGTRKGLVLMDDDPLSNFWQFAIKVAASRGPDGGIRITME